jgi:uncharacterized protein
MSQLVRSDLSSNKETPFFEPSPLTWSDFQWAYAKRFLQPQMKWHRKVRFLARSVLHFKSSWQWFSLVRQSPLAGVAQAEACFLDVIHRPFFDHRLSAMQRADLLSSHYRVFYNAFEPHTADHIMRGQGYLMGTASGKSDTPYDVVLRRVGQFDKEVCLTLEFVQAQCTLLSLTFSFCAEHQQVKMKLGGIQGGCGRSREALKAATQELFGLQPRLLLIWTLRELAQKLGVGAIEAVDQQNHVYKSDRYARRKTIQIDYDDLWIAAGGKALPHGNFAIPRTEKIIPLAERPSHKRAQYRKRSLMLDALRGSLQATLSQAIQSPVPSWRSLTYPSTQATTVKLLDEMVAL